jgi:hypothetical protein
MPATDPGRPTTATVERLMKKLRLTTPLLAVYDAEVSEAFAPVFQPDSEECCFAYYDRWIAGGTLALKPGGGGCKGAYRALGIERGAPPPFMAHMLTDGVGAPKGEGLRASAEVAQVYLDRGKPPAPASGTVLVGPLRVKEWEKVRSVTFLVDPDRLAALTTLAGYWSAENVVAAPFGSACSFFWKAFNEVEGAQAIIGGTDVAMRRHLPTAIMTLTIAPGHFARMLTVPDDSFLDREWWTELMDVRGRWA